MLDTFMRQLAKDLEITDSLTTDVPGVYAFPIDIDHTVFISSIPRGIEFSCIVAAVPKDQEEVFYKQALFANLYGKGTEGAILGLDSEGENITLTRVIDYNLEYKEFTEILEDFLNMVELWTKETASYGTKLE